MWRWLRIAFYVLLTAEWAAFLWFAFIYGQAFADMP